MQLDFSRTRWKLTRRYGLFSAALLLIFGGTVYLQVAESRRALMQLQLQQLASAAASQMPLLLHELNEYSTPQSRRQETADYGLVDTAGINLQRKRILWLNSRFEELSRYGSFVPQGPTMPSAAERPSIRVLPLANGLTIWRPVMLQLPGAEGPQLAGYVSVAVSSASAEEELGRLRRGLLVGGSLGVLAAALAGQWMVAVSLRPIRDQMQRLVRFTADASHELRHPLTAIRAVIGSLNQGQLLRTADPILVEKLGLLDQTAAQMARLVDDLLLLARLDRSVGDRSGWQQFDMADLLEDLVRLYRERAEASSVTLNLELEASAPIAGQPDRLRQLITNLLINALQVSPVAGVVRVVLKRQGRTAVVLIEDQGPGIPPEQRELVFERFWQADSSRSDRLNTGLGLAIARGIANAHGGSIQAEASPGGGCQMVVHLPLLG